MIDGEKESEREREKEGGETENDRTENTSGRSEREGERGCRLARASNLVDMRVQTDWSVECEGTYPRVARSVAVAEARR